MLSIVIFVTLILALSLFQEIVTKKETTYIRVEPLVEPVDLAKIPLPQELFETTTVDLAAEGLRVRGDFSIQTGPGQKAYSRFFADDAGRIWGHLSWVVTTSANQMVMEYSSVLASGLEIATINARVGFGFSRPNKVLFEHPKCMPLDLLILHRKHLLDYEAAGKGVAIPQVKAAAEMVLADMQRNYEAQVAAGILKRDRAGQYYRYTWYGALRAVMNNLFLLLSAKMRPGVGGFEAAGYRQSEDFALKPARLAGEEFKPLGTASEKELRWVWRTDSVYELQDGLDLYATLDHGKPGCSLELAARSGSWQITPSWGFTSRRVIRDAATGREIGEFRRSGWFWSGYRGVPIALAGGGRFFWRSKFALLDGRYEIVTEEGTVLVRGGNMRVTITAEGAAQPYLELLVLVGAYLEGFWRPTD